MRTESSKAPYRKKTVSDKMKVKKRDRLFSRANRPASKVREGRSKRGFLRFKKKWEGRKGNAGLKVRKSHARGNVVGFQRIKHRKPRRPKKPALRDGAGRQCWGETKKTSKKESQKKEEKRR